MSLSANYRARIDPKAIIKIERSLQAKGEIFVQAGQEVSPNDVIGSSNFSGGIRRLDLARLLGVSPNEANKYLQHQLGQRVYKGELLAYKPPSFLRGKKIVVNPTDGILESLDPKTGELTIKSVPQKLDMYSVVYGVVEKVDKEKYTVTIRTQATRIFGLFGSGKSRSGVMHILGGRGDLIHAADISTHYSGYILVCGALVYNDAIAQAVSSGALGLFTGGVNAEDFKKINGGKLLFSPSQLSTDIGLSLVVSEGFGSVPIGQDIFDILQKYNNRFALIEGSNATLILPDHESDCMIRIKNTKLPEPESAVKVKGELKEFELKKGQNVRVVATPFMGEQGKILAIDDFQTLLSSGIKTNILTIETRFRKIRIPYDNVEVIS